MNLITIRKLFRDMSGRYDLVNDDLSNNDELNGGADVFINEGSRWLDRRTIIERSWITHPQWVTQGTWVVQFPTARSVQQVRVDDVQVARVSLAELMTTINQRRGELSEGIPVSYALVATKPLATPVNVSDYQEFFSTLELTPDTLEEANTVIFSSMVPTVGAMVTVVAKFYQRALVQDDDVNHWSRTHPVLLVNSAVRQSHIASGNKALLDIINQEIDKDLAAMSADRVEDDTWGAVQMRSNY